MHRFQSGAIANGHDTWGTGVGPLLCLASAADGELGAGGTADGGLFVMEPHLLEVTVRWSGHELAVNAVDLTADGERLLSASDDGTARLWDVELMKELAVLEVGAAVADARLAAEGTLAVTGDAGGTLAVWRLETGQALARLGSGEPGPIVALDLDPKERTLVAVGPGAGVSVWELDLGKLAR
jgi:WD40 repeat protein